MQEKLKDGHLEEAHEVVDGLGLGHRVEGDRVAHGSLHIHDPRPAIASNKIPAGEGIAACTAVWRGKR